MSAVYPKFREKLLEWPLTDTVPAGLAFYCIAVDSSYTYDPAHNDLADVTGGSIVVSEQALASVTYVNGILDAANVNLTGLDIADTFDAVIVYMKDGGGTSYLAAYIDESTDGSVPQPIDSTKGVISWNDSGIFRA
jgi:hypothetical protein